jgi:predicted amidohydrolase YtcJ
MRLYCHVSANALDRFIAAGIHSGFGDEWLRIGGVKLYADGSISERTAWLSRPYIGIPNNYVGLQFSSEEQLYETGHKAHAAGWQLATHANGDLAIDMILSVYERIQRELPKKRPAVSDRTLHFGNPATDRADARVASDSGAVLVLRVLSW